MKTTSRWSILFLFSLVLFLSMLLGAPQCAAGVRWTPDGVGIRTAAANGAGSPQIVSDGAGGAVITWEDGRRGINDIYAQRVDASGTPQWTVDGVGIRTAAANTAGSPQLVPDGFGGAIVTWHDYRSGSKYDIYARRVDASGTSLWTSDGVGVRTAAANSAEFPRITPDGSGGAIITWQDYRSGKWDIYAQRVNASGTPLWTADGVGIRTAAAGSTDYPQITSDGSGGAIITWQDYRSGKWDIYAQRVNASGTPQWTADGVGIRTA
ncbi:MAG: hypothetical protein AB1384_05785, partial [Actinomycetota bacterium]